MVRRPRAALALLIAMVLSTAAPSAIHAMDDGPHDMSIAAVTPMNRNLIRNGGFDTTSTDGSIPFWTAEGDVRVERFGSRSWPYPAYGLKYDGGKHYLACTGSPGLVRQTIPFTDRKGRTYWLKARLQVDFGGQIGHAIRSSIRVTGPGIDRVRHDYKPLTVTNSYKRVVTWVLIPPGSDRLVATVELVGSKGSGRCRMVADTVKLTVFRV